MTGERHPTSASKRESPSPPTRLGIFGSSSGTNFGVQHRQFLQSSDPGRRCPVSSARKTRPPHTTESNSTSTGSTVVSPPEKDRNVNLTRNSVYSSVNSQTSGVARGKVSRTRTPTRQRTKARTTSRRPAGEGQVGPLVRTREASPNSGRQERGPGRERGFGIGLR